MLWQIDSTARTPLYEQLAATIRRAVASGVLASGDRLPPARELAASLEVNMHTVLRAYQAARDEGLVELRRGRGAVVVGDADTTRLRALLRDVVSEAGRHGLGPDDLATMLQKEAVS